MKIHLPLILASWALIAQFVASQFFLLGTGAGTIGVTVGAGSLAAGAAAAGVAGVAGLGAAAILASRRGERRPKYKKRPSYKAPAPSYSAPAPAPSYSPPAPAPAPSYSPPAPAPAPSYSAPAPAPSYSPPAPAPAPSYSPPAPAPAPSYSAPTPEPSTSSYVRRRRDLSTEQIDEMFDIVAKMDSNKCGMKLVCNIYQKPKSTLSEREVAIILLIGEEPKPASPQEARKSRGLYKSAAILGLRGARCADTFRSCPLTDEKINQFLDDLRVDETRNFDDALIQH